MDGYAICIAHPSQPTTKYCVPCSMGVCVVCAAIDHAQHEVVGLVELMVSLQGSLAAQVVSAEAVVTQLDKLIADVEPAAGALHLYIDEELDSIESTLETKRASLYSEVEARTQAARAQLSAELDQVSGEMQVLKSGQAVLEALSVQEGLIDHRLGGLICERMTFDEFMKEIEAPLHDPPRMLEMLGLQLPTQSLQEVCDLISWTSISAEPTRQIFPVSSHSPESSVA